MLTLPSEHAQTPAGRLHGTKEDVQKTSVIFIIVSAKTYRLDAYNWGLLVLEDLEKLPGANVDHWIATPNMARGEPHQEVL